MDGGTEYDVEDEMCDDDIKPKTKEECNKQACKPEWIAQPFGAVSTLNFSPPINRHWRNSIELLVCGECIQYLLF